MSSSTERDHAGNNNGSFFMKFLLGFIMFIMLVVYIYNQNWNSVPVLNN